VREAIATSTGLVADLEWPNDVVRGRRKLAGILAEGLSIGTPEQAVVLGVGVNVLRSAHPPDIDARALSIEDELGRRIERAPLLEGLLVSLAAWYERLRLGDADDILRAWCDAAPCARGARVEWDGGTGVTAGIDDAGALLVRTNAGLERVIAGEIQWM
jgi:BirA family biotin operon repressor/biotin-[acetyl-CoA-carboxylase] ligase